ncbi:MAG: hydrogenase expression/formation protein HypE [Blastocatellia bacterium]
MKKGEFNPSPLFERVERARRGKPRVKDEFITLAHGSGGRAMHELIEGLFLDYFRSPLLAALEDQAVFAVPGACPNPRLAFTTDSYVVTPIFFPGGDIGRLAVCGTVNDLAMSGAEPRYLSAAFIIEEGFPVADLKRILASMRDAAEEAGAQIVTGDTKVVQRGGADKIFINTAGIGAIGHDLNLSAANARPGDRIILSGTMGDHGTTIMLARGDLELDANIRSDAAPLWSLARLMLETTADIRAMRDPTRGGVATTLNELAMASDLCLQIDEPALPVREEVRGACEILGLDPLYIGNEGKLIAIVAAEAADALLKRMREHPLGRDARIIGEAIPEPAGIVSMRTAFGGTRIVDLLAGEQLPRIC